MSRNRPGSTRGASGRQLRAAVAERYGSCCFYCRRPLSRDEWTLDHYVPYSLWRRTKVWNLVLACGPCNVRKGEALPWPLVWLLLAAARPELPPLEVAA